MGAYRNDVASDNPYWHYELNNNYVDSEGVGPTGGTNYGGSTYAYFSTGGIPDTSSHYLNFSGSVDAGKYLSSTSNAALSSDLDNNDLQTLELWYTPTAIRTSGTCNLIRMDGTRWWMRTDNGYVSAQIHTDNAGGTHYYFADTTTQLQNGTEYHLVWTWDGDKIRIYINGELKATSSSIPGALSYTSMSQCYIGSPGGETANGYIDEIAMYRSALSLTEIQSHYVSGGGTVVTDITVNAVVTDTDVAGQAATVTATTDAIISATVTDIDIAGQPATVTATAPNAIVNAVVTDTDILGSYAVVTAEKFVDVNAVVTDVDVAGVAATVNVEFTNIQNAVVTNIGAAGNAATVAISESVDAVVSNVNVNGQLVAVSAGGNVEIVIDVTDIDLIGKDATVTAEQNITVNAVSTDIEITTFTIDSLYDSLIKSSDPVHWYKFSPQVDLTDIKDIGSSVLDADFIPRWNNSDLVWPPTQESIVSGDYVSSIPGDFGGNAVKLVGTATTTASEASPYPLVGGADYIDFGSGNVAYISPANASYEFWFKTSSSYATILSVCMSLSTRGDERIRSVGIYNGKLALLNIGGQGDLSTDVSVIASTSQTVNDNAWHYVVLTKTTSSGVVTYKSYLDGSETATTISIGDLLYYTTSGTDREDTLGAPRTKTSAYYPYPDNIFTAYSYTVYVDELAIYDKVLSTTQIGNRTAVGNSSESVSVSAVVTDINVDGTSTGTSTLIRTVKSNIDIDQRSVQVSDGTNVTLSSPVSNIQVSGKAAVAATDADAYLYATNAEITVDENLNKVSTDVKNFKFISASETTLSAADTQEISSLNFGGLLFNQEKILLFRIANTSDVKSNFDISIDSRESDILDAIEISTDKLTWSKSITIPEVESNNITQIIYVKVNTNFISLLGPGSFLVKVDQTNA